MQCNTNGATAGADGAVFLSPMAERLLALLRQRPHTTWQQVMRLEGARGMNRQCLATNEVVWDGISEELYQAMQDLARVGLLVLMPCDPRLYTENGVLVLLPLAVEERPEGFTEPHWRPTVLAIPGTGA